MGSFNTACFVSRQTIATGDACKVIPIRQAHTYREVETSFGGKNAQLWGHCHSTCYPDRFWAPIGGFFDAVYDDYGRFTLTDNVNNRLLIWAFLTEALQQVPVVAVGENQSHEIPCDLRAFMASTTPQLLAELSPQRRVEAPALAQAPSDVAADSEQLWEQSLKCWDYLWEVARESRLVWACGHVLRPAGFAVMHTVAYAELVVISGTARGYRGESYAMRDFFGRALESVKTWSTARAAPFSKAPSAQRNFGLEAYFAANKFRDAMAVFGGNLNYRLMGEDSLLETAFGAYLEGKLSDDELFESMKPAIEVRYACSALEGLNLHFEPMVYASQDYHNDVGESYAQLVDVVQAKVTRGRDVHYYGAFNGYQVLVKDAAVFKALAERVPDYDASLHLLSTESHPELNGSVMAPSNARC